MTAGDDQAPVRPSLGVAVDDEAVVRFRLDLVIGSSSSWELDLSIGRFLPDHDGPITFKVRPTSGITSGPDEQTVHEQRIDKAKTAMSRVASKRIKPFNKDDLVNSTAGAVAHKRTAFRRLVESGSLVAAGKITVRSGRGTRQVDTYLHSTQASRPDRSSRPSTDSP